MAKKRQVQVLDGSHQSNTVAKPGTVVESNANGMYLLDLRPGDANNVFHV
jgi:hypothetical protein